ncbi:hypothetical protein HPB52_020346 [Rhipicephalus sanguineus]|uniref:Uncharacterized protein n=1 Tax=Rhipicephalus sanguineus TaxID=34632 RepID=A0A9D4PGJ2_RHISA|nr:hypothetical protein HPB52_020346 [Rhipicephalus sanguineus]
MDSTQSTLSSESSTGPPAADMAAGSSTGTTEPRDDGVRQRNAVYYRRQVSPSRLLAERPTPPTPRKVTWAQKAASSDLTQLINSLRQEIQELRQENQRLRDLMLDQKKGNRSPTPSRSRSRNKRKSRSPTRRPKPVTDKDSAYSHIIGLLRQERTQESNKLEHAIRSEMETRGTCSLPGYRAFQTPTIKHKRELPKGQAALLVRNDCPATQMDFPDLSSNAREIVAVKICPPGQKPFVAAMGEMLAAIKHGRPRSAPGHDRITWQELRNLGEEAQDALLAVINDLWASGNVPENLKLSLIYPIPKHGKDKNL